MSQLRDIAVAGQDFELASYIRTMEDDLKQNRPDAEINDMYVLRELVRRVMLAESQLATMTSIKKPEATAAIDAARFVLETDVDEVSAYHHEFDVDQDGALTLNDCDEGQDSEQLKQTAGLKFLESARMTAHSLLACTAQLRQITAAKDEMVRRNAALRSRPDLPFSRTHGTAQYEVKIREMRKQSLTCCFCNTHLDSVRELKEHSSNCRFHPLYVAAQNAKLPVPSVNMSIDELVNTVCEHLPQGYQIDLELELGAGVVRMFDLEGDEIQQGNTDMPLAEQITEALNEAREMAGQPPLEIAVNPAHSDAVAASLDRFSNTGWPIQLKRARLKLGTVGLLAGQVAVRQMLDAGHFKTAVTLFDVVGPAILLTAFQEQITGPGAKIEVITEDGIVLPMLVGCKADTIGSAAVSNNTVIVSTVALVSPTDITGTDWLRYHT